MKEELQQLCKELRLAHVMNGYQEIPFDNPTQYLRDLFQVEKKAREQGKIKRLIQKARFTHLKTFQNYSFDSITFPDTIQKSSLRSTRFLEKAENLIFMGSVGTGKTHLATAIGIEACKRGKKVRFYRVTELITLLQAKFRNNTLSRFMKDILDSDLLILDELGFVPFHKDGADLLFHLISDCYEKLSVIVTTNLEFSAWNTVFQDNQLTAALIDRLVHHAHIFAFTGESYRLKNALSHKI